MKRSILAFAIMFGLVLSLPVQANNREAISAAIESGDYERAFALIKPMAEQGDIVSQYSLGIMYAIGEGVLQNHVLAAKWLRKAAEQGDAQSQHTLGIMYVNGQGVLQSFMDGIKWHR